MYIYIYIYISTFLLCLILLAIMVDCMYSACNVDALQSGWAQAACCSLHTSCDSEPPRTPPPAHQTTWRPTTKTYLMK